MLEQQVRKELRPERIESLAMPDVIGTLNLVADKDELAHPNGK